MPQQFAAKPPLGVIYNTSMSRPDAVLALALLYGFEGKRESRMGSVCIVGAGLNTAIYCDIVQKFYQLGPPRNGNQSLAVGLAPADPMPPDAPMLRAALEHQPEYPHTVRRFSDTALAEAVIRNGVIFNSDAAMILSGPATYLAKSLDLLGTKELYKERVRRLVIVDAGVVQRDPSALRKVIAEWPTPVFFVSKEAGESLRYPGAAIETDMAWAWAQAQAHPVVDAYRAFQPMPYDAAAWDLLAAHFAVHPDSGMLKASEPGSLTVGDDGRMRFTPGGGKVQSISVDPAQKEKLQASLVELTAAKPVTPQQRFRPSNTKAAPPPPPAKK
jgi:hypothetical protein